MRSAFVQPGSSIHYYVVEFDPKALKWEAFRGEVLGPTDPADAPKGSLRAAIYADWKQLGLKSTPTIGENGVHASASPLEGGGCFHSHPSSRASRILHILHILHILDALNASSVSSLTRLAG